MSERVINLATVKGTFSVPIGVRFLRHEIGDFPKYVEVSTVCLDGAHLEDPLKICEPEHGYETMVFLEGCTFFSLYTKKYKSRKAAKVGHKSIVQRLLKGKLPLAIPLAYYSAWGGAETTMQAECPQGSLEDAARALAIGAVRDVKGTVTG